MLTIVLQLVLFSFVWIELLTVRMGVIGQRTGTTRLEATSCKTGKICGIGREDQFVNNSNMNLLLPLPEPPIAEDRYRNGTQGCGAGFNEWQRGAQNVTMGLNLDDGIYSSWCQYGNPSRELKVQHERSSLMRMMTEPHELDYFLTENLEKQLVPSQDLTVSVKEAECKIRVFRGMFQQSAYEGNALNPIRWYWMPASFGTTGVVFQVMEQENKRVRSFGVPRNQADNCTAVDCASFKTLWLSQQEGHIPYSLFGDFQEADEIPGVEIAYRQLIGKISIANAVSEDTSLSNIAILALPLLLSLPPISILDNVSGCVTLWYWVVTDIFSAIPLMIKGIKLIVVHQAQVGTLATFARHAGKFGVFETWYSHCEIPTAKAPSKTATEWVIFSAACTFIIVSSLIEFDFWKAKRSKLKRVAMLDTRNPLLTPFSETPPPYPSHGSTPSKNGLVHSRVEVEADAPPPPSIKYRMLGLR